MSWFRKLFGGDPGRDYGTHSRAALPGELEPRIVQGIEQAVQFKRAGRFEEADALYRQLDQWTPEHPTVLKSWAKIQVCMGAYDEAVDLYQRASRHYRQMGSGEYWQCEDQINEINNRATNPAAFKDWVRAISGGVVRDAEI